jgi:ATP-dependent Clp protease ATP-binding subunit ClpA
VEKAHRDVWNVFLQILDEGFVTDGKGRRVNMRNTIIIMTSNLVTEKDTLEKNLRKELQKYFRVEFLNRIDDIILYDRLTETDIVSIVKLLLTSVEKRLLEKDISVIWEDALIKKIASL